MWMQSAVADASARAMLFDLDQAIQALSVGRAKADTDIDRTFERGLDSLATLAANERFFLFLHTYTVHDPYEPSEPWRRELWPGPPPPGAFAATGANFAAFNLRRLESPPGAERYYREVGVIK
mgnify:CR=1 FL=1